VLQLGEGLSLHRKLVWAPARRASHPGILGRCNKALKAGQLIQIPAQIRQHLRKRRPLSPGFQFHK
jgi:hypothetical protein